MHHNLTAVPVYNFGPQSAEECLTGHLSTGIGLTISTGFRSLYHHMSPQSFPRPHSTHRFIPPPQGVTVQAWHLLSIFIATIVGIITQPLPLGAVAMLGLGASMLTKTLTFAQAFSAFANEIPYVLAALSRVKQLLRGCQAMCCLTSWAWASSQLVLHTLRAVSTANKHAI